MKDRTKSKESRRNNLMFVCSSVEKICRRHSCSDCPLGPQDDHGCAFTILKNILEKTNKESEAEE